jgi:hypothetical protein
MATVNKDFKIKSGLIVEGAAGTINGFNILTEGQASIDFIVNEIGGTATSANTANTLVKRDANGDFAAGTITAGIVGDLTGDVTGNADTATVLATARTISVSGDATGSVSFNGSADADIVVTLDTSFATDVEVATAADAAEAAANTYTDGEITTLDGSLKTYADTAESDAVTAAGTYTDGRETAITTAYQAYTDAAESNAISTANSYTDTSVAALVDSAPATLDTLNELAAALGDNPDVITNLTTSIGEKVAKAGDTMTGELTLSADPAGLLGAAPKQYVDAAELAATTTAAGYTDGEITTLQSSLQTYADTAETDAIASAKTYTDGQISTVNGTISALDTDDVAEGTNQYFTDERAQDAVAAAIAAGSHANITITYDDANNSLSLQAENGVADSDTDDLIEGSTNLYFTDARAVTALEAVVPNFTEVDINNVATQVAATQSVATAGVVVGYQFDGTTYRTAEFLVKSASGVHTEVSKVLVTLDTADNISITEYGVVGTNGSLSTISAGISGTDVQLLVTTANNGTDVTVAGTLLV